MVIEFVYKNMLIWYKKKLFLIGKKLHFHGIDKLKQEK